MKRIFFKTVVIAVITTFAMPVFAQNKSENQDDLSESITIRKTGPTKDKMTIVIDGDNVTVNGIPVENFKSENVEVTKGDDRSVFGGNDFLRQFAQPVESNKAFLGVMTEANDKGALIKDVTANSPADKAGLKNGDIITKVNDDKINDAKDLYQAIGKYKPDDKVTVTYLRNDKETKTTVTLAKNDQVKVYGYGGEGNKMFDYRMPMPDIRSLPPMNRFKRDDQPKLGLQVQDMQDEKGVKVVDVVQGLPGDKNGIQKDDIITELNGHVISDVDDVKEAMASVKMGDTVSVTYTRNGKTTTSKISFPKKLKTSDI